MPIGDTLGGFIRPGYNPLLVADAPTIGTASESGADGISIAFTAPSDVGGGAITSYEAFATDTVTAAVFTASGSSSPVVVTGLTKGQTYTVTVGATNAYGPSGISAASNSIAIFNGGELWCTGEGAYGQLGQGSITAYSSPVQVGALTTWATPSGGEFMQLAVKTDGTLWTWGSGGSGRLGHGNTTSLSSPVQVGALTDWAVAAWGSEFCAAVKTDGTLWAWGKNAFGQLGQGNLTDYSSPVQVGALTTWSAIALGAFHIIATKTDGTLWAVGRSNEGQLGQGNITNHSSPVQVGALTDWTTEISAGFGTSFGVKSDGTLWTWGDGDNGATGHGNTTKVSSPVQVGALTDWSEITAQQLGGVSVKTDGTLWAWGQNNYGQLGQEDTTNYSSPVQIGALTDWSKLGSGSNCNFSLKTDGTLWAWGYNGTYGPLGLGDTTNRSSPVQVGALTTWVVLSNRWANSTNFSAVKTS